MCDVDKIEDIILSNEIDENGDLVGYIINNKKEKE